MKKIGAAIFNKSLMLKAFKQCLLVGLLCLALSDSAEAIPAFNITTPNKTVTLAAGATATGCATAGAVTCDPGIIPGRIDERSIDPPMIRLHRTIHDDCSLLISIMLCQNKRQGYSS